MNQRQSNNGFMRKLRKLRRDPVRFFEDARSPVVRDLGLWIVAQLRCLVDTVQVLPRLPGRLLATCRGSEFRLAPLSQLTELQGCWKSTGQDPQFAITARPWPAPGGWTLASFEVADLGTQLEPVLYVDDGAGFREQNALRLPAVSTGSVRHLLRLPRRVTRLRLNPLSGIGDFRIERFSLTPVTGFAALRYLRQQEGKSLAASLRAMRRAAAPRTKLPAAPHSERSEAADRKLLQSSPLFDEAYYLEQYQDVAEAGLDPIEHYNCYGAREGRNPSRGFETLFYLGGNPDVAGAKLNPLVHFIRHGNAEGRRPTSSTGPVAPKPKAPPAAAWRNLAAGMRKSETPPTLDVIVPVYRGYDDTLACLYSVLMSSVETPFELVVIDDQSPEPALSRALEELAGLGLITLLVNEHNLGFVGTVNRGMRLHDSRDVLLLNSDTEVYGDWLDRLRRHVQRDPDIGTITPFSNNATICSYPLFDHNNRSCLEVSCKVLDGLAAWANAGRNVDLPTGVGFCFYVTRTCLDQVGLFDEARFGRGYGEENDFCLRAAEHGWRNVLAADVFVRHTGEVSFAAEAEKTQQQGLKALLERHPGYGKLVSEFLAMDSPAPLRRQLDLARLRHAAGGRAMLFVSHRRGGGVERHLRDMADGLAGEGVGVLVLRSLPDDDTQVTIEAIEESSLPNLNPVDLSRGFDALIGILAGLNVFHIHVHSLADYPDGALRLVPEIAERLGVDYDFTVHDYIPICPRINLIDQSGVYCGEKGEHACRSCLATNGSPFGRVDIGDWRRDYGEFLEAARSVFVPNPDVFTRMNQYFPEVVFEVRSHPEKLDSPDANLAAPRSDGEPLRVAIIGAIGPHKGSQVLLDCARDALERELPLEFVVIGYSDKKELDGMPNVTVTGAYDEAEVFELIGQHRCHLAFIPSVWPETYCYTLSIAAAAGLHTISFDLGAIAERIGTSMPGHLLPVELMQKPGELNDAILQPPPLLKSSDRKSTFAVGFEYQGYLSEYYNIPEGKSEVSDADHAIRDPGAWALVHDSIVEDGRVNSCALS